MDVELRNIEGVIGSFGKRGVDVIALSSQNCPKPPAFRSRYITKRYHSPSVREKEVYLNFLRDLPHRGVLLYSSDESAEFSSENRKALLDEGYLLNIVDIQTFHRAFDKDRIFRVCGECGVPTMSTRTVEGIEDVYRAAEEIGFPIILKATRLAGGQYRKISSRHEISPSFAAMQGVLQSEAYANRESGMIVQEYIEHGYDDIYCCESFYAKSHDKREFLSIRKLRPNINYDGTPGSRLHAGKTVQNPILELLTRRVLDHLQWSGFAHLDWLYSPKHQSFMLCEINPRLPGFSNFLTTIGFDMAWNYYADLTDKPRVPYRFKPALYFEALRHPGDLTTNLLAVRNGYVSFSSFIKSYLEIFSFRYKVVLDVLYSADPLLSWENYKISARNLFRKAMRR